MTEIITYRLSATGVWQYEFCREGKTVGSVASVVSLREPARIEGTEISWYSRFDMDTEIVPGVSRKVKDNRTGEEVYRIVWWKPDLYEVRTKEKSLQVEIRNGSYLFGDPMMPVTATKRRFIFAFMLPPHSSAYLDDMALLSRIAQPKSIDTYLDLSRSPTLRR